MHFNFATIQNTRQWVLQTIAMIVCALIVWEIFPASGAERVLNIGKYVLVLKKKQLDLWYGLLKVEEVLIFRLEQKRKFDHDRSFNRFISARNQSVRLRRIIHTLMKKVLSSDPAFPQIMSLTGLLKEAQENHAANIKRLRELAPKDINTAIKKANEELEDPPPIATQTRDFPLRSLMDTFDPPAVASGD